MFVTNDRKNVQLLNNQAAVETFIFQRQTILNRSSPATHVNVTTYCTTQH